MRGIMIASSAMLCVLGSPSRGQTLGDVLATVCAKNPTLLGEHANRRAVAENAAQARSAWRPTISLNADLGYSKGPYSSGEYGTSYEYNDTDATLSARQTLYSFGRIADQVRAAEARSEAEGEALRATQAQLLLSAVTAYMDVLRDRAILDVRRADLEVLERQVREVSARYALGGAPGAQVTRSDVEQSQAQRQSAIVARARARAALAGSEAEFRAVVGSDPGALSMPEALAGLPVSLVQAEQAALVANPLLAQSRSRRQATAADLDAARSQWGPQVQLQVAYGGVATAAPFSRRTVSEQTTGTVTLTQPLYSGGLYESQIRQARDRDEQALQAVERARRQALQAVATDWAAVGDGLDSVRAGIAQVRAGQTALRGTQLEYGYGLRSTTELLYADQTLRAAQVDLATSRHDIVIAEAQLLAATGRLAAGRVPTMSADRR